MSSRMQTNSCESRRSNLRRRGMPRNQGRGRGRGKGRGRGQKSDAPADAKVLAAEEGKGETGGNAAAKPEEAAGKGAKNELQERNEEQGLKEEKKDKNSVSPWPKNRGVRNELIKRAASGTPLKDDKAKKPRKEDPTKKNLAGAFEAEAGAEGGESAMQSASSSGRKKKAIDHEKVEARIEIEFYFSLLILQNKYFIC